ncbi:LAME_0G03290g1_1 [Lachancea meyersii CBS 8951]|uniref:LAME_0G03290g1_1 n=1 Tax=Lachancea meyersii CBS 8951 TaxID=1266667 RepID=A0A1G4K6L2_9SACH|nr:LAME_0G03290g1_1 [Lachancea meyersii CBS 8951]
MEGAKATNGVILEPHTFPVPEDSETIAAIEKTADYVRRNGVEFEQKLDREQFPFLAESNQYNKYYRTLLEEDETEGLQDSAENSPATSKSLPPATPSPFVFSTADRNVPKRDLEIVKKTALFCVLNEKNDYLNTLRAKGAEHPLLGFLDTRHPLNEVFTNFINQYKQVARKEFGVRARFLQEGQMGLLNRCFERAKYAEFSEKLQVEEAKTRERFKLKFFSYAWENFQTLGSVEFKNEDEYAEPLDFDTLRQKTLQLSSHKTTFGGVLALSSLAKVENVPLEKDAKPKKKNKMKIRAAGETRLKQNSGSNSQTLVECPITHKMIPEANFDKHIQVLLSDPNYTKERQEYEAKNNITNLTLENVHQNIKRLSQNRSSQPAKRQKT